MATLIQGHGSTVLELRADTFSLDLEFAALGDLDGFRRAIASTLGHVFNLFHDVVAFEHLAKDDVLAIEPANSCTLAKLWEEKESPR